MAGSEMVTTERAAETAISGKSPFPVLDFRTDALLLDIDGTIVDIALTPEAVKVPGPLKLHLSQVREKLGGALALISGRTLAAIDELFAPVKFVAVGCHGAELRLSPDGKLEQVAPLLTSAEKAAFAEIGKLNPLIRVEDKHYTLAIHYRRVPQLENELFGWVNNKLGSIGADLEVICGKAVIEIKSPGFNKGTGLEHIMQQALFSGRRPIYFGDDTTDEDAFAVLPQFHGVGISVGRLLPGAQRCVARPALVRDWLGRLSKGET